VDALRSTLAALQNQLQQIAQAPPPSIDPVELSGPSPAPTAAAPAGTPAPSTAGLSPSRMLDSAKSDYFAKDPMRVADVALRGLCCPRSAARAPSLLS